MNIIVITGYSCSGKSTVIEQLKDISEYSIIKFGSIHRETVKNNGYIYAKDWIKDKGFEIYDENLLNHFRNKISLYGVDSNIIIDGLFSYKCFDYLKNNQIITLNNIVLDTKLDIRITRMIERENMVLQEAIEHLYVTDCIKERSGLSKIMKEYDYIINGNSSREKIKEKCSFIIQSNKENMRCLIKDEHNDR